MKRSLFLFVVIVSLSTHNVFAQVKNNTFDYQAYQMKVQKFIETLTPEEKTMFYVSFLAQNKSSRECELDWSTKDKIDKIYDILEEVEKITCDSSWHGKLECERKGY